MADGMNARPAERRDTQLHAIRDLMLAAARRGAWLTLGEIAQLTEIGEASVSAQLRHLRKRRYGRHLVEKRRRVTHRVAAGSAGEERCAGNVRIVVESALWEYRVMPSAGWGSAAGTHEEAARTQRLFSCGTPAAELSGLLENGGTTGAGDTNTERCCGTNPGAETERCADVAGCIERQSEGVSDAEARN